MKTILGFLLTLILFSGTIMYTLTYEKVYPDHGYQLKTGDLVFQQTNGSQGLAVQYATKSQWSHVGMVIIDDGEEKVFEANHATAVSSLNEFRARSEGEFYAMRLADDAWNSMTLVKLKNYQKSVLGTDYDTYFKWSDQQLYCSEFVWKIYENCLGVELCPLRQFNDYNLSHPHVAALIEKRYGSRNNLPKNEKVVAPSDLAESKLLVEVPSVDK